MRTGSVLPRVQVDAPAPRSWRTPLAVRDPGKVVLDLTVTLALGGHCLADVAALRTESGVYGRVASDPTESRLVDQASNQRYAGGVVRACARRAARSR